MELMLQAIEICRLRSAERVSIEVNVADRPCIRSFVEAVLVSAVVSMESRLYHRAWQTVASVRGATCDMLSTLISKATTNSTVSKEPLTVDMGWVIERMIEIISLPDVVEQDGLNLVNLDKRRCESHKNHIIPNVFLSDETQVYAYLIDEYMPKRPVSKVSTARNQPSRLRQTQSGRGRA